MRLYLVRHGESISNIDRTIEKELPSHAVPLSERGKDQAKETGRWFESLIRSFELHGKGKRFALWSSPYFRARQTEQRIYNEIKEHVRYRRTHVLLCEQQFGLFDGIPEDELPALYPGEHAHYKKCEDFGGRFWARMPLGESRFDVAVRVHQAFGTFHRDAKKHDVEDLIIVSHGVTIRAFVMMWCHKDPEWFDAERNPKNCSVRLITDGIDQGYVFDGFKKSNS